MTKDYELYFNRQIKLWGLNSQLSLKDKKIAIIGCGGLGSSLAIALGSSGIGKISLVDFDEVGVHNIHRQIAFKTGDEGKFKCDVIRELLLKRCPYVEVRAYPVSFEDFANKEEKFDLIIDATDNLGTRGEINKYAKKYNQVWLYGSVEEFHGQICLFDKASFESVFKITNRTPGGIACPIVMHIASFQANIALRYLLGMKVKKDLLYYVSFTSDGILDTKKFNLPVE